MPVLSLPLHALVFCFHSRGDTLLSSTNLPPMVSVLILAAIVSLKQTEVFSLLFLVTCKQESCKISRIKTPYIYDKSVIYSFYQVIFFPVINSIIEAVLILFLVYY